MSGNRLALSADWIATMSGPPLRDHTLVIESGRIKQLVPRIRRGANANLPASDSHTIIAPGFINLHSHLDYSALASLEGNSLQLLDWIVELVRSVRSWSFQDFLESARQGARHALVGGTTTLIDSSYSGASALAMAESGLKGIVGLELFGIDASRPVEIFEGWLSQMDKLLEQHDTELSGAISSGRLSLTVSPHAPYTVSPQLYGLAGDWAIANQRPVLTHLAESPSEESFIERGDPQIESFLEKVMPPTPGRDTKKILQTLAWNGNGDTPVRHLERAGVLGSHVLAAHCTTMSSQDLDVLEDTNTAIAHCPRSNSRLTGLRAPLELIRQKGIRVGLGTDSLASSPSLSMLDELRYVDKLHGPHMILPPARERFAMVTRDAADAIGLAADRGTLEPGKAADLVVIRISRSALDQIEGSADPETSLFNALLNEESSIDAVFINGQKVVEKGNPI